MTIDNVTSFVGPTGTPPPPETLEDHFGNDAWMLRICAKWRALRAQQEKNWAENEVATGWGSLKSCDFDRTPLEQMAALQHHLAGFKPRTVLLARELLRICMTILARQKEDPEHVMADGPILEIVRNVVAALEFLDNETRLGPETDESSEIISTPGH